MNHCAIYRFAVVLLSITLLLSLAACEKNEETSPDESAGFTIELTEKKGTGEKQPESDPPVSWSDSLTNADNYPAYSETAQKALDLLREIMEITPRL